MKVFSEKIKKRGFYLLEVTLLLLESSYIYNFITKLIFISMFLYLQVKKKNSSKFFNLIYEKNFTSKYNVIIVH